MNLKDVWETISDPVGSFNEAIDDFFARLAEGFVQGGMGLISDYLIKSTSLSNSNLMPLPIDLITNTTTVLGSLLAFAIFYLRLLDALRNQATEEAEVNYAEIVGSFIISLALVVSCTTLIEDYIIPISNDLTRWIAGLEISDQVNMTRFDSPLPPDIKGEAAAMGGVAFLLAIVVWALGFIGVALVGAIRYAEIAVLLTVGPILMGTYANRSDIMRVYWIKTLAVIFTQPLQVFLLWGILVSMLNVTWQGIILSFGFCVLAFRGPVVLEQLLYSTGIGGAGARMAGMAGYRLLLGALMKRK